jgi:hypothetical protein
VLPEKVKGKTHWLPVSGPDTVVQVEVGVEVVQVLVVQTCSPKELQTQVLQSTVDTWPGVQVVEGVVVVVEVVVVEVVVVEVVEVVVVVEDVQTVVVQTGCPSAPHTQVLQSTV